MSFFLRCSGVLFLLLGGCARKPLELQGALRGVPVTEYFPLAVGNTWTYEETLLGATRTSKVEITHESEGFFVDNRGGKMRFDAYGLRDDKRYLLREPLEPGKTWTNVVAVGTIERYRVLGLQMECGPARAAADCVKVESTNRIDEGTVLVNELTFAPGVGLVMLEMSAEVAGRRVPQSRLLLKSFEAKKIPSPR